MARRSAATMTTKVVLALAAALALALPAAATNEGPQTGVYLRFYVTGCGGPLVGANVIVSGCVDSPTTLTTDTFGDALLIIDQCFGSSRNLCSYSVFDPLGRVSSFTLSATTLLDSNGSPISPNGFSQCQCDGSDACTQYYPATVTASPANGVCNPVCNPQPCEGEQAYCSTTSSLRKLLTGTSFVCDEGFEPTGALCDPNNAQCGICCQQTPPPCPTTCSVALPGKGEGETIIVPGTCTTDETCPEGSYDSGEPCDENNANCGKCCIPATSLCGETNGKPCADSECFCFERSKPGAACAAEGASNGGGCEERACNAFFARTAGTGGACCPEPACSGTGFSGAVA